MTRATPYFLAHLILSLSAIFIAKFYSINFSDTYFVFSNLHLLFVIVLSFNLRLLFYYKAFQSKLRDLDLLLLVAGFAIFLIQSIPTSLNANNTWLSVRTYLPPVAVLMILISYWTFGGNLMRYAILYRRGGRE